MKTCVGCKALSETTQCKLKHTIKRSIELINGHRFQQVFTNEDCANPRTNAQYIDAFDEMIAKNNK
jgi:hypothetical protein|tara:strand:- start:120 stop:317 length:198 start_codon:yes stop_codon:yes gene_type:complete